MPGQSLSPPNCTKGNHVLTLATAFHRGLFGPRWKDGLACASAHSRPRRSRDVEGTLRARRWERTGKLISATGERGANGETLLSASKNGKLLRQAPNSERGLPVSFKLNSGIPRLRQIQVVLCVSNHLGISSVNKFAAMKYEVLSRAHCTRAQRTCALVRGMRREI
jgi:hypothetical protein